MIDVEKFVVSLIKHYCEAYGIDRTSIRCWFDDSLEEQGLEYKDGKIVKTQRRVAAEAKEAIFESEDERIRKVILDYFKDYKTQELSTFFGIPTDNIIAWLEKQGGQKSTDNKEKLGLLNFIRKETGCGLAEANNALLKLIKALKQHPFPIMDKYRKLKIEWEE